MICDRNSKGLSFFSKTVQTLHEVESGRQQLRMTVTMHQMSAKNRSLHSKLLLSFSAMKSQAFAKI